jgi:hypothetical protein
MDVAVAAAAITAAAAAITAAMAISIAVHTGGPVVRACVRSTRRSRDFGLACYEDTKSIGVRWRRVRPRGGVGDGDDRADSVYARQARALRPATP